MDSEIRKFCTLIREAPDPYFAVKAIKEALDFTPLSLEEKWQLEANKRYFIELNGFAFAFITPKKQLKKATLLASHIDSPALKLNPRPIVKKGNRHFFEVDRSGGIMYTSWLDRDLQLSGKIRTKKGEKLVHLKEITVSIPNLPIHLDREKNEKHMFDPSKELLPFIGIQEEEITLESLFNEEKIEAFDLYLTPKEEPQLIGLNGQYLASYRLDNMTSAYACLEGLLQAKVAEDSLQCAIFYNDEETGSHTIEGAMSPLVDVILERICLSFGLNRQDFLIFKRLSSLFSLDVAHTFVDGHEGKFNAQHKVELGKGITFKRNHLTHYAYDIDLEAISKAVCEKNNIPYQLNAPLQGKVSGSTIGPHAATQLGIKTIDTGICIQSMHSAREFAAIKDLKFLIQYAVGLYNYAM